MHVIKRNVTFKAYNKASLPVLCLPFYFQLNVSYHKTVSNGFAISLSIVFSAR